jgi:hypothetical protein
MNVRHAESLLRCILISGFSPRTRSNGGLRGTLLHGLETPTGARDLEECLARFSPTASSRRSIASMPTREHRSRSDRVTRSSQYVIRTAYESASMKERAPAASAGVRRPVRATGRRQGLPPSETRHRYAKPNHVAAYRVPCEHERAAWCNSESDFGVRLRSTPSIDRASIHVQRHSSSSSIPTRVTRRSWLNGDGVRVAPPVGACPETKRRVRPSNRVSPRTNPTGSFTSLAQPAKGAG